MLNGKKKKKKIEIYFRSKDSKLWGNIGGRKNIKNIVDEQFDTWQNQPHTVRISRPRRSIVDHPPSGSLLPHSLAVTLLCALEPLGDCVGSNVRHRHRVRQNHHIFRNQRSGETRTREENVERGEGGNQTGYDEKWTLLQNKGLPPTRKVLARIVHTLDDDNIWSIDICSRQKRYGVKYRPIATIRTYFSNPKSCFTSSSMEFQFVYKNLILQLYYTFGIVQLLKCSRQE